MDRHTSEHLDLHKLEEPRSHRLRQLLEGLENLFFEEGFLKFRMEDLARRLRCSKNTLYVLAQAVRNYLNSSSSVFSRACVPKARGQRARLLTGFRRLRHTWKPPYAPRKKIVCSSSVTSPILTPAGVAYEITSGSAWRNSRRS